MLVKYQARVSSWQCKNENDEFKRKHVNKMHRAPVYLSGSSLVQDLAVGRLRVRDADLQLCQEFLLLVIQSLAVLLLSESQIQELFQSDPIRV